MIVRTGGCCKLKEEAVHRTVWRTGWGPEVRQTEECWTGQEKSTSEEWVTDWKVKLQLTVKHQT
jgi:hypothetical protein